MTRSPTSITSRPAQRSAVCLSLALIAATLGALAFSVPALALAPDHGFKTTFAGSGTNALSNPTDVAVDNSTGLSAHDVYVTDPANHRIEKFSPSGEFILMFGKEVNETTGGNVCTAISANTCKAGTSGNSPGEFETPTFVAVDNSCGEHVPPLTELTTPKCTEFDPSSGDVYIGDTGDGIISKFDESGNLIGTWGTKGQLTGFGGLSGIAADPTGNLFIETGDISWYEQSGTLHSTFGYPRGTSPNGLAVDGEDHLYKIDGSPNVTKFSIKEEDLADTLDGGSASGLTVDPSTNDLFVDESGESINHFALNCGEGCAPIETFGGGDLAGAQGLSIDGTSDTVYVANTGAANVAVFEYIAPTVTTGAPSNVTETSATLNGNVDPSGHGEVIECSFEYGISNSYGEGILPCEQGSHISSATSVTATLSGLQPTTKYHYRLVASNVKGGVGDGRDETLLTSGTPAVDGLFSSNLGATTATLSAKITPNGSATKYYFEYGPSTAYGETAPSPPGELTEELFASQPVDVHLTGLQKGFTYHFRVVAVNKYGTTTTADQSFNFFPPTCPNAPVRQQTGGEFLPDCRAYELVSPESAGNVILFPGASNLAPSYATDPARFAFFGGLGAIEGTNPPDGFDVDSYVATRTDQGWVTHYVGILGDETVAETQLVGDSSLSKFIQFKTNESLGGTAQPPENIPYVFDSNGNFLEHWPADFASVPDSRSTLGAYQPSPDFSHLAFSSRNVAFPAANAAGITTPPGSAYDYNVAAGSTQIISIKPNGGNIEQQPSNSTATEESILFPGDDPDYINASEVGGSNGGYGQPTQNNPGVSTDGSHILMSTASRPFNPFQEPPAPEQLYMRVDDAATYEVSENQLTDKPSNVNYMDMTSDGSKVFFTSEEQLTSEPTDGNTELYMWSAEKAARAEQPLTVISKPNGGTDDTNTCNASWISGCGVLPVANAPAAGRQYSLRRYNTDGADSAFASETGEVYFYSPLQLDGTKGVTNQENLYVYRDGEDQFVVSLRPGQECDPEGTEEEVCGNGPLTRIEVTPDGSHMAFLTGSEVTSYNSAGFQQMYTYEPSTGKIVCVSCLPSGAPPTGDVVGSEGGLFLANDGRTFFYSPDALVPQDTDEIYDIYEYVEGRPQLITSGTGFEAAEVTPNQYRQAGLQGVSADGVNVYFSTYETLVPQDRNGQFLKIYDARTDGGFPDTPPPPPCAAADECHGAGSSPPTPPTLASEGELGSGGDVSQLAAHKHKTNKKHHVRKAKRHHRGGGKK